MSTPQQKPIPANQRKKLSLWNQFYQKIKHIFQNKWVYGIGSIISALAVIITMLQFLGIANIQSFFVLFNPPTCLSSSEGLFKRGVINSGTIVTTCFQPQSWQARYVILHYRIDQGVPQNVDMAYNAAQGDWEYTIEEMNSSQKLMYWYTYEKTSDQKNGLQHDTRQFQWSFP